MKKFVLYGINYAPEPIGVGKFSAELAGYLARQGIQVEIITAVPHYPGWQIRNGFSNWYSVDCKTNERITRCPIFLKNDLRGVWRLIAPLSFAIGSAPFAFWRIIKSRPDVVLCVQPTLFSAPMALLAGKLVGARCFLHVQDLEVDAAFAVHHLKGAWLRTIALAAELYLMRAFDKIITISHRMAEKIIEKGIVKERVAVIRNWVDLEKIRPLLDVSSFRAELGISRDQFVALYAGNIGLKQSLPTILDVAERLRDERGILFLIVGEGPEKRRLVGQYGNLPNVRFLPVQSEHKLCELLNSANVHLLPQERGAADLVLPSKLGGMLASGKPCLVMADEGTELFNFLYGSAVLLPPGNTDELENAIIKLYRSELDPPLNPSRAQAFDSRQNLPTFQSMLGLGSAHEAQCEP